MKLFAFRPGYGRPSFYVAAGCEEEARSAVEVEIARQLRVQVDVDNFIFDTDDRNETIYSDWQLAAWKSGEYSMTVYEPGQVALNSND